MINLRITKGAAGLRVMLRHALALDSQALIRFRLLESGMADALIATPFQTLIGRRAGIDISADGAVLSAQDVKAIIESNAQGSAYPQDALWPGALPPATGFELVEELPVAVVADLADKGRDVARQFAGPMGPPKSLLDQSVIRINDSIDIPMRMIFSATSYGFIPSDAVDISVPRILKLNQCAHWLRLDSAFGSVYYNTKPSLLII